MERHTLVFADVMGRLVLDASGRSLGRVVAVVHRRDSADVLVKRGILRRELLRLGADELILSEDGYLIAERVRLRGRAIPLLRRAGRVDRTEIPS